jgi:UDP-2,3-diacylglucosamine pyrophosphatase LpxH
MQHKYLVIFTTDENKDVELKFKTFKEMQEQFKLDLHTLQNINGVCEGRIHKKFIHHKNKDIYNRIKIYNIKPNFNIIK